MLNTIFPNAKLSANDLNSWIENSPPREKECVENSNEIEEFQEVDNKEHFEKNIKHVDVINSLEICIKWGQQNNIDFSKLMILRDLQEEAVKKISIPK